MICQATYDSLEAIPEAFRGEFEQRNGKWVLKADAVPGAAEILNPGLAANRDRAIDQARTRGERVTELEGQLATAQSELNAVRQPGSVVLSGDDAKAWSGYTALGALKDVKKIIEEHPTLVAQVEGQKKTSTLQQIADETGLNFEVLRDWAQGELGKGLEFFTKEVDGEDGKKVKVLAAKKSTETNGKVEVSELDFDAVTQSLPSYMKDGLVRKAEGDGVATQQPTNNGNTQPKGVKMPNLGGGSTKAPENGGGSKKPVDVFNARRAARPNPLKPASNTAGS